MAVTPELNTLRQIIEHQVNLDTITSVQAVQLDDGIHIVLEADVRPDGIEAERCAGVPLQWWWRDERHITRPLKKPKMRFMPWILTNLRPSSWDRKKKASPLPSLALWTKRQNCPFWAK